MGEVFCNLHAGCNILHPTGGDNYVGWLRDMMDGAEPPVTSFGRLARLCLDAPQWPPDTQPKLRSLSTLFSKLDRGQDLDWLRDRVEVQQVLAHLLGRPLASIREAVGEIPHPTDGRLLRLADLRYARELDLAREALPPGIPSELQTPPEWGPSWWVAPSGAGRSLLGQWLAARGLAHLACLRGNLTFEKLPPRGALYLDIDSSVQAHRAQLGPDELQLLRAHARPLLVAAPFPPRHPDLFRVVTSPPVDEFLPELVDWVQARLDGSGALHPEQAERWIRRVAIPAQAARTLGDTLGLLGVLDEVPARTLGGKTLDDLAARLLRDRLREAGDLAVVAPRLPEEAFALLRAGAARILVEGGPSLDAARSVDEWIRVLAAPRDDDQPDPQWFNDALRGALGEQVSRRALRKAADSLAPTGHQLFRALQHAGFLVRCEDAQKVDGPLEQRKLHPRWLVSMLLTRAFDEVLLLGPGAWGRVLFYPAHASAVLDALLQEGRAGRFQVLHQVADDLDESIPEHLAALEAAVVVTGLLVLEGHDVPEELTGGLIEHTAACVCVLDGIPTSRFTLAEEPGLFHEDLWLAGLCSLTASHPFPLRHLDPLRTKHAGLRQLTRSTLLRLLASSARDKEHLAKLALGLLLLLERATRGHDDIPEVVRLVNDPMSASHELFQQAASQCALDHLALFLIKTGAGERATYEGLWRFLASDADPQRYFVSDQYERALFSFMPTHVLVARVQAKLSVRWDALLPHQFAQWLGSAHDASLLSPQAAAHAPPDVLVSVLARPDLGGLGLKTLQAVLARVQGRAIHLITQLLRPGHEQALNRLLSALPAELGAEWVESLEATEALLALEPRTLHVLRAYLLRVLRGRELGFERAMERLLELDRGISALRSVSG